MRMPGRPSFRGDDAMSMRALDRKLLRDLRLMWSQALTIALVVASGVAGFITTLSAVDSLALARDRYYAADRFADVFATVETRAECASRRAGRRARRRRRADHGRNTVRIEIPGISDPIMGHLIGVDPRRPSRMNRVTLRSGRTLHPEGAVQTVAHSDGTIDALVSEGFAQARGSHPERP